MKWRYFFYYETLDGRFFSVGSLEPSFRKQLCEALGIKEYLPYSFSEVKEELNLFKNEVKRAFSKKTFNELIEIFSKFDACAKASSNF
ncbi:CoA transferase [Gottfriedia acidiceleris]|uniref:CoA transferase n=1 Tax=Gottfriedia acidiceleris TaxID=371036 RepID=UPI003395C1E0